LATGKRLPDICAEHIEAWAGPAHHARGCDSVPVTESGRKGPRARLRGGWETIGEPDMKWLNVISMILVIIGAINWGLVGLFGLNLVAIIFGFSPILLKLIYIIVGLAGVYQIMPLSKSMQEQMA
jgi:uncharacterized protein